MKMGFRSCFLCLFLMFSGFLCSCKTVQKNTEFRNSESSSSLMGDGYLLAPTSIESLYLTATYYYKEQMTLIDIIKGKPLNEELEKWVLHVEKVTRLMGTGWFDGLEEMKKIVKDNDAQIYLYRFECPDRYDGSESGIVIIKDGRILLKEPWSHSAFKNAFKQEIPDGIPYRKYTDK